jgi:hypothetical protein
MFKPEKEDYTTAQIEALYAKKSTLLKDRAVNITSQFVRIFRVFKGVVFINNLKNQIDELSFVI